MQWQFIQIVAYFSRILHSATTRNENVRQHRIDFIANILLRQNEETFYIPTKVGKMCNFCFIYLNNNHFAENTFAINIVLTVQTLESKWNFSLNATLCRINLMKPNLRILINKISNSCQWWYGWIRLCNIRSNIPHLLPTFYRTVSSSKPNTQHNLSVNYINKHII